MREPQKWAETHNDELHSALDRADPRASEMMRTLVDVQVDHRNSVVEELYKWYDGDMDDAVATARRLGGGFFQKVWDGNYADAYLHADAANQRIIEQAYDLQFIREQAADGYLANVVQERWTGEPIRNEA
jgi:hypothetical protein